jgi:hypothetical protein
MLLPHAENGHNGIRAEANNGADSLWLAGAVLPFLLLLLWRMPVVLAVGEAGPLSGCPGAELEKEGEKEGHPQEPGMGMMTKHGGQKQ